MAWTDSADCDVCISQYGERERKKINTNYCNTKGQTQVQQTTMESASKNIELCVYGNYYLLSNKNYDYFVAADNASWHCAIRFDLMIWCEFCEMFVIFSHCIVFADFDNDFFYSFSYTIRWLVHNRCLVLFDWHYGPFHLSLSRHFLQLHFLNLIFVFLTPKSFSTNCARIQHKRWSTLRISMALTVYNSMNLNIKYNRNIKRKTKNCMMTKTNRTNRRKKTP